MIFGRNSAHIEKNGMIAEQLMTEIAVGKDVDVLLQEVYEPGFYAVARFISKRGGTLDDARDIFQDAFVILYERHQRGIDIDSPARYITGIAKHLWYKELESRKKAVYLADSLDVESEETKSLHDTKLLAFLTHAGKRCFELLEAFYFRQVGLRSITKAFGFGSDHSTSVQKYKCLEKLRSELKSKSLHYEDFIE